MTKVSSVNFKGYDARPLKGVLLRNGFMSNPNFLHLSNELSEILNKEQVDIFLQDSQKITKNKFTQSNIAPSAFYPYVQDSVTFMPNHTILTEAENSYNPMNILKLSNFFKQSVKQVKKHFPGGNFFFIKDGNKDSVIMGRQELSSFMPEERIDVFGDRRIYFVPQPDYHIDLSIRPLNNKKILVNSPELLLKGIQEGIQNAKLVLAKKEDKSVEKVLLMLTTLYEDTQKAHLQHNLHERYKALMNTLKQYNFEVISVPAAVEHPESKELQPYSTSLNNDIHKEQIVYDLNYINALVHERPNGSIVYITNKSDLDKKLGITSEIEEKIGFSFEKMFKNSLKGLINEEDIYFVGGQQNFLQQLLSKKYGGLHCITSEIPV